MQSGNRRGVLEMAVIRMCDPSLSNDLTALERRVSALEKGVVKPVIKAEPVTEVVEEEEEVEQLEKEEENNV